MRFEVRGFGIQVVLIEPGLIKSNFADAAVRAMGTDTSGPYGAFSAAVRRATVEAYHKGPLARLAGTPEDVATTICKAATARRPRARYTVSGSAKLLLAQRRLLSDRLWDAFLRSQFPTPQPAPPALASPPVSANAAKKTVA